MRFFPTFLESRLRTDGSVAYLATGHENGKVCSSFQDNLNKFHLLMDRLEFTNQVNENI